MYILSKGDKFYAAKDGVRAYDVSNYGNPTVLPYLFNKGDYLGNWNGSNSDIIIINGILTTTLFLDNVKGKNETHRFIINEITPDVKGEPVPWSFSDIFRNDFTAVTDSFPNTLNASGFYNDNSGGTPGVQLLGFTAGLAANQGDAGQGEKVSLSWVVAAGVVLLGLIAAVVFRKSE
jgi:hypothetical protein